MAYGKVLFMIIKIIGGMLIVLGCGGFGILLSATHKYEVSVLQNFIEILDFMECELSYRQTPLPELCRLAAANNNIIGNVFSELSNELDKQLLPDVEKCVMTVLKNKHNIPKQTEKALCSFGRCLGKFDLNGQLKGICAIRDECMQILASKTKNQDNRLRCYRTLGICAGAAIAILFI